MTATAGPAPQRFPSPEQACQSMLAAARRAGEAIMRHRTTGTRVIAKSPGEIVTAADLDAQTAIVDELSSAHSEVEIYAEEGPDARSQASTRFIVDPLDGTTPWVWGNSGFAVSIAYERAGIVEADVVFDPVFDEMFVAVRGTGAFRNGEQLHVSEPVDLPQALVVFDWGNADTPRQEGVAAFSRLLLPQMTARRVVPQFAPALGLARIAEGRIHALACNDTWQEDHAAGTLLVREAGGVVYDFDGEAFSHRSSGVLAACDPGLARNLRRAWMP